MIRRIRKLRVMTNRPFLGASVSLKTGNSQQSEARGHFYLDSGENRGCGGSVRTLWGREFVAVSQSRDLGFSPAQV